MLIVVEQELNSQTNLEDIVDEFKSMHPNTCHLEC